MQNKFLLIIITFILLVVFGSVAAQADLASSSYKIQGPTISGGGEDDLQSESYKMRDLKGQGISGSRTSDSYELQLGGIYSEEEATKEVVTEIPTAELVDIGWIRNTKIVREGENLRITWGYDPARPRPTKVDILAYSDAGAAYSDNPDDYGVTVVKLGGSARQYVHAGIAHDGNNYYYRVIPSPSIGTDLLDDANNSITVGKIEQSLMAGKYVFLALPFQEDAISLKSILGEQVLEGGEFLWWSGAAYDGATYSGRSWTGTDRILRMGEGFILKSNAEARVAFLGRFGTLESPYVWPFAAQQYNLISYPYPTARKLGNMGITPLNGNEILKWFVYVDDAHQQYYDGATYNDGWVGLAGVNDLELGMPRYYLTIRDESWTISFP